MHLTQLLDTHFGPNGEAELAERLRGGADPEEANAEGETPLHVAVRRCRPGAVAILLDAGARIETPNAHGKTAYVHAVRRGFQDVASLLEARGARTELGDADRFAVAVTRGRLEEARSMLATDPGLARTGNPEEDRLLADVAGRNSAEPVRLLLEAGADLEARALDDGTALHQAAWFGQPENARLLLDAGASLEVFDGVHQSSPLGWAVHGSRYSGGAEERRASYVEVVRDLLAAGSRLRYPGDAGDAYRRRLLADAPPEIAALLTDPPD